jgi:hypothetical protein
MLRSNMAMLWIGAAMAVGLMHILGLRQAARQPGSPGGIAGSWRLALSAALLLTAALGGYLPAAALGWCVGYLFGLVSLALTWRP